MIQQPKTHSSYKIYDRILASPIVQTSFHPVFFQVFQKSQTLHRPQITIKFLSGMTSKSAPNQVEVAIKILRLDKSYNVEHIKVPCFFFLNNFFPSFSISFFSIFCGTFLKTICSLLKDFSPGLLVFFFHQVYRNSVSCKI